MRRRYGAGCLVLLVALVVPAYLAWGQRITNQPLVHVLIAPTAQTVADNGNGGTAATGTITYTTGLHVLTCSDAQGCTMTLSETGAIEGHILTVINTSANNATFSDSAGVQIVPASTCTLEQYETIMFVYAASQWNVLSVGTSACA